MSGSAHGVGAFGHAVGFGVASVMALVLTIEPDPQDPGALRFAVTDTAEDKLGTIFSAFPRPTSPRPAGSAAPGWGLRSASG